jgi:serine/threonine protein kinase
MKPEDDSRAAKSLRDAMESQHPGIVHEIEGAIRTLHKLKGLADSGLPGQPPANGENGVLAAFAATAALTATSAGTMGSPAEQIAQTEVERRVEADVPILACGSSFGRYQIVRLLGRGAMGAVYLAYDTQLHRHVALKTPLLSPNSQVIQRFYREARAAAQLRSPYTCPIHDAGQIGHIYYLSMAFIEGQPLTRAIAEGRLRTAADIASVIKKIAQGLQKAHELGIIHRDLKPDNIMIDNDGEPIVMDFGLARRVDDDAQVTMNGVILGTPAYMSPEQVDGDPQKIGPATDIYSLGVILYQMLTGRLPFKGSITVILRQIGRDLPAKPSSFNQQLGEDSALERICLKMMSKSPADRYASMADVAKAVGGAPASQDVAIVKPSALSRVKSWSSGILASLARQDSPTKAIEKSSMANPPAAADQITLLDSPGPT